MGIPTGDEDVVYGNNCLICWQPEKTPAYIAFRIQGIMAGDLWVPIDGAPPNFDGFIYQSVLDPCDFLFVISHKTFFCLFEPDKTTFGIAGYPWGHGFISRIAEPCVSYFPNDRQVPAGNHFYGGHAQIIYLPGTNIEAVHFVQDLLNIEHSSKTFASGIPFDDDTIVYRFGRRSDATNILVKIDP